MKTKDHKTHIGIYGRRNLGKSSIINTLADQQIAIVSDTAGTTTDPVKKSFEILDYAPVILVDTAGIDDTGDLGTKRIEKTLHSISTVDLALLVIADNEFGDFEKDLIKKFDYYKTPFFIIHNKSDKVKINEELKADLESTYKTSVIDFSTVKPDNFEEVIDLIKKTAPESSKVFKTIIGDLVQPNDVVMLICPIDSEAPAGRMILPQVQLIRDVLDNHCVNIVLQQDQVTEFFKNTNVKPKLAITDSQIFDLAGQLVPKDIPLTSFSTVLARQKGDFENYLKGTPKIDDLKNGDRVLILESCSHHVSCEDIGRFKLPAWLRKYCNCELEFDVVSGLDAIQRPITDYAMVIQCGGCMITKKQILNRLLPAIEAGIPVSNYGLAIAYVQGIYQRAVEPFKL
ncbi:[FeFe] hydrogenase H-cluster maturation GTPase HydF [Ancylomarina salipaludis]|uniref:[FeFe] hydrogenase H-cluster maturation GTPase HydF n=1 Tax=Ancylomarina salipaludis TaxID=2501299 RepID=A0A4Q1JP03_9BACT|nr:[FeFe] hydrogenase H-cluster maturation GTPase HydF [Ancylomarina salipaludis]RXQ96618.1 [FeFe] hydrogenase H-cluster maturation GTPase HydF [Ancylomarina salipaludis]